MAQIKRIRTKDGKFKLRVKDGKKYRYYKYRRSNKNTLRVAAKRSKYADKYYFDELRNETDLIEQTVEDENFVYALVMEKTGRKKDADSVSYAQLRLITPRPLEKPNPAKIQVIAKRHLSSRAWKLWNDFKDKFQSLEMTENMGTTSENVGIQIIIDYAGKFDYDEFKRGVFYD